jgi:hypothetical protein
VWGRTVGGGETACSPDEDGRVARCTRRASSFWCQVCRMSRQPSIQRALQAKLRIANRGFTWLGSQRIPACFIRLCTTSLLALSTDPLPMG